MNGQWWTVSAIALAATLLFSGCSAQVQAPVCELPEGAVVTDSDFGASLVTLTDGTLARLGFAHGSCNTTFAYPIAREERSADQLVFDYDYYVQFLAPCLYRQGYPLITPPTRNAFIDSGGDWSPYDTVLTGALHADEILSLTTACPAGSPWRAHEDADQRS